MDSGISATLPQLSGFLKSECLEVIRDSASEAVNRHMSDEYPDSYKFGTWLWKDILERFKVLAAENKTQYRVIRRGGVEGLAWQGYFITHHRVEPDTQIPNGAEAAKKYARQNTRNPKHTLFGQVHETKDSDWVVLGFEATPEDSLTTVFVGILSADVGSGGGWTYSWLERSLIWSVDSNLHSSSSTPVEGDVSPTVKLQKPDVEQDPEVDVRKKRESDEGDGQSQSV